MYDIRMPGPTTIEGKQVSKMNAVKHGILSNSHITCEYDSLDAEELFNSLTEEFQANTIHQKMIVQQLVSCYVKLQRLERFQKEIHNETLNTDYTPFIAPLDEPKISPGYKAVLSEDFLKRLELGMRYETSLVNRMLKLINELKNIQLLAV